MTVIGLWLAIVGYGLAYSGMVQLGGGKCSLVDGFRSQCQPGIQASAAPGGQTQQAQLLAQQRQQVSILPTVPIPQGSSLA